MEAAHIHAQRLSPAPAQLLHQAHKLRAARTVVAGRARQNRSQTKARETVFPGLGFSASSLDQIA